MLIVDNYLDHDLFLAIRSYLLSPSFPWEPSQILSTSEAEHLPESDNLQLVHGFYLNKPGFFFQSAKLGILKPLLVKLAPLSLLKIKANRTARRDRHIEYGLHVDTKRAGASTAIYYLNTNNGYTRFADGQQVMSVENRLVLFDAATSHTGASCTDADERVVLNLNFMPPPNQRW